MTRAKKFGMCYIALLMIAFGAYDIYAPNSADAAEKIFLFFHYIAAAILIVGGVCCLLYYATRKVTR